ncbi:MAG: iron ABC transporter permease [Proteobacteria bacterium]|nr:iron ABC transporter permease [Pseudomonadota bacterium]
MPSFSRIALNNFRYLLTGLAFLLALGYALASGSSDLSLGDVLLGKLDGSMQIIFWQIRLPRILVAASCGAALAAAGVISQGIFRNPLAGPSIIGTTGGANLCVVALIYFGAGQEHWALQPLLAFLGALASTLLLLQLAEMPIFLGRERLLLLGFALNSIYAAVTSFILSLSLPQYGISQAISYWLLGGINGKAWLHVLMMVPGLSIGLVLAYRMSPMLDVLNLGEDIAASLSLSIANLRKLAIICLSLLVASAVAVCGGIAFVGLIVPHISRLYMGARHSRLLPISTVNGMTLLIAADTLARTLWAPEELQVGAIISLIGAPAFVFLLLKRPSHGAKSDV